MRVIAFVRMPAFLGLMALLIPLTLWQGNALQADPEEEQMPTPKIKVVDTAVLGGNERYTTHLSTDKPIYKPQETVYIRGALLHAITNKPLTPKIPNDPKIQKAFKEADSKARARFIQQFTPQVMASFEIRGPKGEVVANGNTRIQDSTAGFSWQVPEGQAGGQYKVKLSYPWQGYTPAERSFEIRNYRPPRLKSQIVFVRDGYGPADTVSATLHVERAEGGIPVGADVEAIARVDAAEVFRGPAQVDAQGNCTVKFQLPEKIVRGEGTLALVVQDGGIVETASKTIPILLQTVDLQMYPEGGDLVAGLPSRVYLEAKTPYGKPADFAGIIVNANGQEIARFRTEHEGRARVSLVPQAGEKYTLKITEPAGISTTYPLPALKADGTVLSSTQDVYKPGQRVTLAVASTQARDVVVTLRKKEQELGRVQTSLAAGQPETVSVTVSQDRQEAADGVLIATAYDAKSGMPLAERLVLMEPGKQLKIEVTASSAEYIPGDNVELTVKTSVDGKPVSAVVGLTVTDDSVLEMIEKREQAPRLPVMVFLEDEVQELADAHVYLDVENEKAPQAVDLLLGTQGWRRFALMDTTKFLKSHGDDARRVLALALTTEADRAQRNRRLWRRFRGGDREFARDVDALELFEAAGELNDDGRGQAELFQDEGPLLLEKQDGQQKGKPRAAPNEEAQRLAGEKDPLPIVRDERAAKREKEPSAAVQALSDQRKELKNALRQAAPAEPPPILPADIPVASKPVPVLVAVREYAHQVRKDRQPGDRRDFAETLYWSAATRTDEKTGTATISFGLSDAVTTFRVFADGFHSSGALGSTQHAVESVEPFYIEPKLPLEVTTGDQVLLPLGLVNATAQNFNSGQIAFTGQDLPPAQFQLSDVPAGGRIRQIVDLVIPAGISGNRQVVVSANAGGFSDQVTRELVIQPRGFPVELGKGGLMLPESKQTWTVSIPESVVPGSINAQAKVFPTPLGNLTAGLERLIREPYGCFEQTSSTTYPLVMAQQYFTTHTGVDPGLIERSSKLLEKGYNRLTGFECKTGGYEWFGQDPGHLTLTAFGLMEFTDMAEVSKVDTEMLARTREWLLKQRDGQGSWKNSRRALHTWVTNEDVVNSYVTWCLLECGEKGLEKEIAWVKKASLRNENSYVLALAANVLWLAGDKQAAREAMDDLGARQNQEGWLDGAEQSVVGSRGQSLNLETTALATLAWLRDRDYADSAQKGMTYLAEQCKGGRFGSTQSTVLTLRAIVAYDKAMAKPKHPGSLRLIVDGKTVGQPVAFDPQTEGEIVLPDFAELLKPGDHVIEVAMEDGSSMPFSLAVNLHNETPDSAKEATIKLKVKLTEDELIEGGITEAAVKVTNTEDKVATNPIAIIGIPGGLEVRHDQLKELVKAKKIAAYEVLGRDVVLYWRELQAEQSVELPISLVAAIPGRYTGPASRSYLYYGDEHKDWVPGLTCSIAARQQGAE